MKIAVRGMIQRAATAVLAAVLAVLAPTAAPAAGSAAAPETIVAVCDPEVAPYRTLLDSFTTACGCLVDVVPPAEAAQPGFEGRLKALAARAVLAVGIEAQAAVEGVRSLPVLLTAAPHPGAWVAAAPNRLGVELSLSPRRHLETLRSAFPGAQRVGVLHGPANGNGFVTEAREAAAALGLSLEAREVARPADLARQLAELRGRIDVLWLLPDPVIVKADSLEALLLASFESRVPVYAFARKYAELGAVAATQLDLAALGAQAAGMLRERLGAGAGAAGAPLQYARGATLVLNRKVARKMGLDLPPALLESADVIR